LRGDCHGTTDTKDRCYRIASPWAGNGFESPYRDYFASHGLGDFITGVDGRTSLLDGVEAASAELRRFVGKARISQKRAAQSEAARMIVPNLGTLGDGRTNRISMTPRLLCPYHAWVLLSLRLP
jgi:hypothetical protein